MAVLSSILPMQACDFSVFFNRGNRGHGVLRRMVKCDALFSGFSGIPRVRERLSDGVHNSAHSLSMTRAELSRQNPFGGAIYLAHGPVAQRLEQGTHNPLVPGSNPGGPSLRFGAQRRSEGHAVTKWRRAGCFDFLSALQRLRLRRPAK